MMDPSPAAIVQMEIRREGRTAAAGGAYPILWGAVEEGFAAFPTIGAGLTVTALMICLSDFIFMP